MKDSVDAVIKTAPSLLFAFLPLYAKIAAFNSPFWVDAVAFVAYVIETMLGWITIVFAVVTTESLVFASFLVYSKIATVSSINWGNSLARIQGHSKGITNSNKEKQGDC